MNHDMAGDTTVHLFSTFEGHVLPGALFILWAMLWIAERFMSGPGGREGARLETTLHLPILKVVLPLVGVWIEIPGDGWGPMTTLMSWQHVTMYFAFALTGVVDLLARRGRLSGATTYAAYAAAHVNAGALFWGHAVHGGVDGVVHKILALAFFGVAALALLEIARPSSGILWARVGAQLALGSWFILGGWILYLSGWDLMASTNEGRATMYFSWMVMAIAATTVLARMLAEGPVTSPNDAMTA